MDTVTPEALGWAKAHIDRYGDTDIFPRAFEFEAIKRFWPEALAYLQSLDLSSHEVGAPLRVLVPKFGYGFRVATQLDPFDSLLYLAMAYDVSWYIEALRVTEDERVACSYRVDISPDGQLFKSGSGWKEFHSQSMELSEQESASHVVSADIADFYNQIYSHRVATALETAGVEAERCESVENFLMNLTARQSRGVPVGPAPSILLAEACLADVDDFLRRKGFAHTRYVDDFRIFTSSREEAIQAIYHLTDYLSSAHKLCLQSDKTAIWDVNEFISKELQDPEDREIAEQIDRLNELIGDLEDVGPYDLTDTVEVTPEMENQATRDAIISLFQETITSSRIHFGFARHLLRRASALRTRVIYELTLENIERLFPVLRDVIIYLLKVFPRESPHSLARELSRLLESSDYRAVPFVQLWLLHALSELPKDALPAHRALALAENSQRDIRDRMAALIAGSYGVVDWVRERKENWSNTGPRGQRAILWAGTVLPKKERAAWLGPVARSGSVLNRLVARAAIDA